MGSKVLDPVHFTGLLLDLDGTLVDSTSAVNKHWNRWGQISSPCVAKQTKLIISSVGTEIGVDPKVILQTSHGRRTIDTLKIFCPEKANWKSEISS